MTYKPRNSRFNREAGLLGRQVLEMERKNGMIYFLALPATTGGAYDYAYCAEEIFDKEFTAEEGSANTALDAVTSVAQAMGGIKYQLYPSALIKAAKKKAG